MNAGWPGDLTRRGANSLWACLLWKKRNRRRATTRGATRDRGGLISTTACPDRRFPRPPVSSVREHGVATVCTEPSLVRTLPPPRRFSWLQPIRLPGASAEAIRNHYDFGDDFFGLWLGPERVYSAALFEADDDLDAAQVRKLDHHIAAAGAAGKARVLDVGCGWGAMLRRLDQHAGVKHAVGLTLSTSQAAFARELRRAGDRGARGELARPQARRALRRDHLDRRLRAFRPARPVAGGEARAPTATSSPSAAMR